MVDLKLQYAKIKDQVDAGIREVLDSAAFINGPAVQAFADELGQYLGSRHIIPCANGTDALQIAMMALGLEPGDEVITPSFTYIATTEVVALLRLKPVFVEVDPLTFCIDPGALEAAITPRTKAIVPVHLYGQAAPMEEILSIARKHGLFVIEDNAQAIGASYTRPDGSSHKTGTMGDVGCISFFPSKNLGAYGDGGAICTDDDALAAKMRMIANHGQSKQYYHDIVGCNSRLDALQAAILRVKLRELDGYIAARRKVADFYDAAFAGHAKIKTPYRASYAHHTYHQYTLQLEGVDRDALKAYLATKGIPAMIYYPVPGHRQKMFSHTDGPLPNLEVTDRLTERVISLPMHTELDEEQLFHIITHLLGFINL
jgi:UDP-2-acetamido-2-deoxy-ribo-hexuluronate aminotransferase